MNDYSPYIPQVHFEMIPIKDLVSSQSYQRNLSVSHVQRTVQNFDLYQINPVKVSRRDGTNYVFNGQHTIETVAFVSGTRETPVWCMIYDDLDYTQEADIFANQQKFVKSLKPHEIFKANVEAGNEEQLVIRDLVASYGLTIGSSKAPGRVCAVSTLEYIHQRHGFHVLDRTLRLCVATWEGEINSLSTHMLRGVAHLIVIYGDEMNDEIFKEKVGFFSPEDIKRNASGLAAGVLGYAEAILDAYNKKTKPGLPWVKLHSHKFVAPIPSKCSTAPEGEPKTATPAAQQQGHDEE